MIQCIRFVRALDNKFNDELTNPNFSKPQSILSLAEFPVQGRTIFSVTFLIAVNVKGQLIFYK